MLCVLDLCSRGEGLLRLDAPMTPSWKSCPSHCMPCSLHAPSSFLFSSSSSVYLGTGGTLMSLCCVPLSHIAGDRDCPYSSSSECTTFQVTFPPVRVLTVSKFVPKSSAPVAPYHRNLRGTCHLKFNDPDHTIIFIVVDIPGFWTTTTCSSSIW